MASRGVLFGVAGLALLSELIDPVRLVASPRLGGAEGVAGAVHGDDGGLLESALDREVHDLRDDGGLGVVHPVLLEVALRLNTGRASGLGVDGD